MHAVSGAYRDAIQLHRAQGVRNRSYANIYIGQFDVSARGDAALAINDNGLFYSNFSEVNSDAKQEAAYATWEQDFFRLDGVQRFLPQKVKDIEKQGFVSAAMSGADGFFAEPVVLTISFTELHRMSGITLLFDDTSDAFASEFTIATYINADPVELHEIENTDAKYEGILTLTEHNRMVITFHATSRPFQRLRLQHLLFGIGFVYDNDEIMDIALKRSTSPVSLELPSTSLGFSLYNENGIFTPDSPGSVSSFFSQEQECSIAFGYDVTGAGGVEWVGAGKFLLSDWTADGIDARFNCNDIIDRMSTGTYRRGTYGSKTAKAMIDDVMTDYGCDDYDANAQELEDTIITNPLPVVSHAECLQLVANCAMCTLETSATGRIYFRSRVSAVPEGITASHQALLLPCSDESNLVAYEDSIIDYASWEQDGFTLSGDMLFVPDLDEDYIKCGVGWGMLPQTSGAYEDPPSVTFDFAANVTFGSVVIAFGPNFLPSSVQIEGFRNDGEEYVPVYAREWAVNSARMAVIDNFDRIGRIVLTLPGCAKAQNPRIKRVAFNWENGYEITSEDILGNPKGRKLPNCRNVIALLDNRTAAASAEIKKVTIPAGEETWIEHGDMYQDVTVSTAVVGAVLTYTSFAYATCITVTEVSGDVEVALTGKKLIQGAEDARTIAVNTTGEDCTIENPLLSSGSIKSGYMEWLAAYFGKNIEWSAEVLGYPELQPGDLIAYKGMPARLLDASITYRYSLRGQVVLRKEESF